MHPISRRAGALAVALLAVALGCGGQPSGGSPDVIQLVPDPQAPRDERFLTWGATVTIADVPRTTLSASKAHTPPPDVTQGQGPRQMSFLIPAEFKDVAWIVLESIATRDGSTRTIRAWPVANTQAGGTFAVGVTEPRLGPGDTPGVRLLPVPDLATRDVETAEVTIPEHAVFQAGIGIETGSWDATAIPVDMTVSTVAGETATVLGTTRIDIRRPEHRRWTDLSIPLDALAGRTVRLRFSARPAVGPSAVPILPVWAEPIIADPRLRLGSG
jgi:hypothetical protein